MSNSKISQKFILDVTAQGFELRMELFRVSADETQPIASVQRSFSNEEVKNVSDRILQHVRTANLSGASEAESDRFKRSCQQLYDLLLPADIQRILKASYGASILLRLDRTLIGLPWELVHDNEDFFCLRFNIGREIKGLEIQNTELRAKPVRDLSFLVVSDPRRDLPAAAAEASDLYRMVSQSPQVQLQWLNGHADREEIEDRLGRCDLLHFCGHTHHPKGAPELSGWLLSDGVLTTANIRGIREAGRPFPIVVFSNSCRSAECGGSDGREMDSFNAQAHAFLASGTQHFIGTLSEILDESGRLFARSFYQRILEGEAIGEAFRAARLELLGAKTPNDFCWAQYIHYGDPAPGIFGKAITERTVRTLLLVDGQPTSDRRGSAGPVPAENCALDLVDAVEETLEAFPEAERSSDKDLPLSIIFSTSSEAIRFSLQLHARIRREAEGDVSRSPVRIAISSGEFFLERPEGKASFLTARGLPVEVAKNLFGVSRPGQTLSTRSVFDDARAILRKRDLIEIGEIVWLNHGPYRLANLEEPIWVCEIGEKGHAPLAPPVDSEGVYRLVSPDEEPVLGWRPALEKEVSTSPDWVLIEKLGEGGFGEVWRAKNRVNSETCVFKFCFKADRVRSLKREITLIHLLRESLGSRPDIVQAQGLYLDEPPFYIVMEDVPGSDLCRWLERYHSHPNLTEGIKLEIIAKVADALQASHEAGVIHRDVKPTNILVLGTPDAPSTIEIKLTDFGIGQVWNRGIPISVTPSGFTDTYSATELGSRSGSWLYMAPEILMGKESTTRSDLYSLGVILYQLLLGDCKHPLPADWENDIKDPILVGDIRRCLARNPSDRFAGAEELAQGLRGIGERRKKRTESEAKAKSELRRKRLAMAFGAFGLVAVLVSLSLGIGWMRTRRAETRERNARQEAERGLYHSQIHEALEAVQDHDLLRAKDILYGCADTLRGWEWGRLVYLCNLDQRVFEGDDNPTNCMDLSPNRELLATGNEDGWIKVWDFKSGEVVWRRKTSARPIKSISVSFYGVMLAETDTHEIRVWNPKTELCLHRMRPDFPVEIVRFAPNRDLLAAIDTEETLYVHDLTNEVTKSVSVGSSEDCADFAFTPDGKNIIAVFYDSSCRLFDVETLHEKVRIEGEGEYANAVAIDDGGDAFVIAFGNQIRRGALSEAKLLPLQKTVNGTVRSFDIDKNQRLLAYKTDAGFFGILDIETFEDVFVGRGAQGSSIRFDPDGESFVVIGGDNAVRQYASLRNLGELKLLGHTDFISGLTFSHDGQLLATGSDDQTIRLWDTHSGESISILDASAPVSSVAFSPNNRQLVAGTRSGEVLVWDLINGRQLANLPTHASGITDVGFNPMGGSFAGASLKGNIHVWNSEDFTERFTIETGKKGLFALRYSPDGRTIAAGASDYTVKEWDAESGILIRSYVGHSNLISSLAFLAEGDRLITGGADRRVILWDRKTGEPIAFLYEKEFSLMDLEVAPDSKRLFTTARIWDIENRRPIMDFPERRRAFGPDGLLMAEGGEPDGLRILPAFPWRDMDLSEKPGLSVRERVEEYKQRFGSAYAVK